MTDQAKLLKSVLKRAGCTRTLLGRDRGVSVTTLRRFSGTQGGKRYYEYGAAKAHVDLLTVDQIAFIESKMPYVKIVPVPSQNTSIVYSS